MLALPPVFVSMVVDEVSREFNRLTIRGTQDQRLGDSRLSHQHRNGKIGEHRAQGQGPSLNGQALARQRIEEPLPSRGRYEQAGLVAPVAPTDGRCRSTLAGSLFDHQVRPLSTD